MASSTSCDNSTLTKLERCWSIGQKLQHTLMIISSWSRTTYSRRSKPTWLVHQQQLNSVATVCGLMLTIWNVSIFYKDFATFERTGQAVKKYLARKQALFWTFFLNYLQLRVGETWSFCKHCISIYP